jgi:hypothetical protein
MCNCWKEYSLDVVYADAESCAYAGRAKTRELGRAVESIISIAAR